MKQTAPKNVTVEMVAFDALIISSAPTASAIPNTNICISAVNRAVGRFVLVVKSNGDAE